MSENETEEEKWNFKPNEIVREKHAKPSPVPGESEAPKKEYRIKRRLVDPDNGDRYYHVEKEDGDTHLFSAGVMRQYERIAASQSRAWSKEPEVKRSESTGGDL